VFLVLLCVWEEEKEKGLFFRQLIDAFSAFISAFNGPDIILTCLTGGIVGVFGSYPRLILL